MADWGEILAGALAGGIGNWATTQSEIAKSEREAERDKGLEAVKQEWEAEKLNIQLEANKELNQQKIDADKAVTDAANKRQEERDAKADKRNEASDALDKARYDLDAAKTAAMIGNLKSTGGGGSEYNSAAGKLYSDLLKMNYSSDEAKRMVETQLAGKPSGGSGNSSASSFISNALGRGNNSETGTSSQQNSGNSGRIDASEFALTSSAGDAVSSSTGSKNGKSLSDIPAVSLGDAGRATLNVGRVIGDAINRFGIQPTMEAFNMTGKGLLNVGELWADDMGKSWTDKGKSSKVME